MKKAKKIFKGNKGFTLLEILVVLTIMGFLIAMVAPRLANMSGDAVDTVCDSNQNRMVTYMSSYFEKTSRYPNQLTNIVITDGATLAAATYQIPSVSNGDPDDGAEVLAAEFNDRNHFHIHYLDADEAAELKSLGIVELYNLNDYSGIANAIADTTNDVLLTAVTNERPSMEPVTPAAGIGVAMVGCGVSDTTGAGVWIATNKTERGWGEPDWFGRIVLGMGPECDLITDGVIGNAAHCPGGLQNDDNVTYNDYNLVLPRLEATVAKMEDTTNPITNAIALAEALPAVQYDDEPGDDYDYAGNSENLKYREFDITEVQETWQYATQCPEGHMYPEDDGEFWGIDLGNNAQINS